MTTLATEQKKTMEKLGPKKDGASPDVVAENLERMRERPFVVKIARQRGSRRRLLAHDDDEPDYNSPRIAASQRMGPDGKVAEATAGVGGAKPQQIKTLAGMMAYECRVMKHLRADADAKWLRTIPACFGYGSPDGTRAARPRPLPPAHRGRQTTPASPTCSSSWSAHTASRPQWSRDSSLASLRCTACSWPAP